jgi:hypothetical protein
MRVLRAIAVVITGAIVLRREYIFKMPLWWMLLLGTFWILLALFVYRRGNTQR